MDQGQDGVFKARPKSPPVEPEPGQALLWMPPASLSLDLLHVFNLGGPRGKQAAQAGV